MSPPMWFLGAYEVAIGGLHRRPAARRDAAARQAARRQGADRDLCASGGRSFRRLPRAGRERFSRASCCSWPGHRPGTRSATPSHRRRRGAVTRAPEVRLGWRGSCFRDPAARAGFDFTLATMWRSNTHRLTLACCGGGRVRDGARRALQRRPAAGGAAVGAAACRCSRCCTAHLLVGFRHMIRVPAELRANWGFQLAWRASARAFVAGVQARGAALACVAGDRGRGCSNRLRDGRAVRAAARRSSAWPARSSCSRR